MLELDVRKEKRKMPSKDEVDYIFKCKTVWTKSMNSSITVITKTPIALEVLFGRYFDVIKLNLKNIVVKTEDQVTLEDLDGNFVEF